MIYKICFVVLLGCVLARASPVVSKLERASSKEATIDDDIQKISEKFAAQAVVGLKFSNDVIVSIIKSLFEVLPSAISEAMSKKLTLPHFEISERLRKLMKDTAATVVRELMRTASTVNQLTTVPRKVLVAAIAPLSSSPLG